MKKIPEHRQSYLIYTYWKMIKELERNESLGEPSYTRRMIITEAYDELNISGLSKDRPSFEND